MVRTLETNHLLVRTKLGYLRHNSWFEEGKNVLKRISLLSEIQSINTLKDKKLLLVQGWMLTDVFALLSETRSVSRVSYLVWILRGAEYKREKIPWKEVEVKQKTIFFYETRLSQMIRKSCKHFLDLNPTQSAITCSKLTIEGVTYVNKVWNIFKINNKNANGVVPVSLLLTLNIFHTLL